MTRYGTLRNPTLTETADRCDTHTRIPSVFTAEPSPARLPPALAPSAAAPATSCYYLPALADAGDSAAAAAAEGDGAGAAAAPAAAPPKWRGAGGRSWNTQRRKVRGVRQVVRVESSVSETKITIKDTTQTESTLLSSPQLGGRKKAENEQTCCAARTASPPKNPSPYVSQDTRHETSSNLPYSRNESKHTEKTPTEATQVIGPKSSRP